MALKSYDVKIIPNRFICSFLFMVWSISNVTGYNTRLSPFYGRNTLFGLSENPSSNYPFTSLNKEAGSFHNNPYLNELYTEMQKPDVPDTSMFSYNMTDHVMTFFHNYFTQYCGQYSAVHGRFIFTDFDNEKFFVAFRLQCVFSESGDKKSDLFGPIVYSPPGPITLHLFPVEAGQTVMDEFKNYNTKHCPDKKGVFGGGLLVASGFVQKSLGDFITYFVECL